jgi:hypothetical protein
MAMNWTPVPIGPDAPASPYAHAMRTLQGGSVAGYLSYDTAKGRVTFCRGDRLPDDWSKDSPACADLRRHACPMPVPETTLPPPPSPSPEPEAQRPLPGEAPAAGAVYVGVIDNATAFANERFRRRTDEGWRSRVDFLWLQGAPADDRIMFGRCLYPPEIDALIGHYTTGGLVDEEALYRHEDVGLLDMASSETQTLAFAAGHGTAVLDLAGGFDPDDARGDAFPLMVVELPTAIVRDTIGTFVENHVAAAIEQMIAHVEAREAQAADGRTYPIVITISFALSAGAKDGSGLLDRVMRSAEARRRDGGKAPIRFVLPAGNHRMSRARGVLHAAPPGGAEEGKPEAEPTNEAAPGNAKVSPATIGLCLLPDDRTLSFVEFWGPVLPESSDFPFSIGVASAHGGTPTWLSPTRGKESLLAFDLPLGVNAPVRAYCDQLQLERGGWRHRITLAFPPTRPESNGDGWIEPGDYTIAVRSRLDRRIRIDVHVQRDDTLPGFRRRGRQSVLLDPAYHERDRSGRLQRLDDGNGSPIRRAGTRNALASGSTPIVVGATQVKHGRDAFYSGLGSSAMVAPPQLAATVDRGDVAGGMRVSGIRSGSRVAVTGTSFAGPQVARLEAEALAADPDADALEWLSAGAGGGISMPDDPVWARNRPLPAFRGAGG